MISPALRTARKNNGVLWEPYAGSGCVLWLPGQDDPQSATIRDRSRYNNHGTITGATWKRLPSGLWALNFDGTDDYVNCGSGTSLNFTTQNFSTCFWQKFDSLVTEQYLVSRGAYNDDGWFIRHHNTVGLVLDTCQSGASQETYQGAVTLSTGIWYHLAFIRNGTAVTIYANGVALSLGQVAVHNDPATSSKSLLIGCNNSLEADMTASGSLWSIQNIALSATEIASRYRRERHLFGI